MISLRHIVLRRGSKVLLDGASASINPGEKIGLVGRNGAGKTSVFALLAGLLQEDGGQLNLPSHWQLAQVSQDMPETDQSASDFVVAGDQRLMQARADLQEAQDDADGERIAQAFVRLHDAGDSDAKARAQALILGLGFGVAELEQPVNSFSGGWRMRLQLARALMCPSDLLLLDEPTNHLDLDALVWLESWLQRYNGTLIVISHDREFLDAVTRSTLHIEQGLLFRYAGNYSQFESQRAEKMALQAAAYARQQDRIAHLQKFIDRFKAKATKAKQAQSRVKALERMDKIAPLLAEADFNFSFRVPASLPNPMLSLQDVSVGYPDADQVKRIIVQNIRQSVLSGQRIGILGANGQGKSTLVKTIAGTLAPRGGRVIEGKGLRFGYFAQQELDVLRLEDSPLQHMTRLAREGAEPGAPQAREQELRNFLGQFNFSGDMVMQAVGSMSGGEKARLVLAMLVWQRPNLLVLDEPTNHLDLATRQALSLALNEFEGSLMLVSHDRALLRTVCDEFWLVAAGALRVFDGDLEDYQRYLLEEARRQREQARKPGESASGAGDRRKQAKQALQQQQAALRPLRKELQQVEERLAAAQAEQQELERELSGTTVPQDLASIGKKLKSLQQEIEGLEERWLELGQAIEQV
ncbi:MAG: ATP-binding cassette domain-containing protein [Betaproteobacteria bacterium]|nr:ATP-binding cassette domain-containing protein [Betaproteobacteria bacterium]